MAQYATVRRERASISSSNASNGRHRTEVASFAAFQPLLRTGHCAVNLRTITKAAYALIGVLYVVVGAGSIALPAGWISTEWAGDDGALYAVAAPDSFLNHLTQEFGTLAIAVGLVFLWQARRQEHSRSLHWLLTFYLALDAFIHWVGPQGLIGSLQRGLINSIPLLLLLMLGLLWRRADRRAHGSICSREKKQA